MKSNRALTVTTLTLVLCAPMLAQTTKPTSAPSPEQAAAMAKARQERVERQKYIEATAEYPSRELAVAAAMAGDMTLALRHWDRSLSSRRDKPTVLALAGAGCRDELISRAQQALRVAPGNEGAKDVLTWLAAPITQPK